MKLQVKNDTGLIKVNSHVFGQIAKHAIEKVNKSAWLATSKGKLIEEGFFQSKPDYSQAIECQLKDNVIDCNIYIICRFGKSIKQVSKKIIESIKSDLSCFGEVGDVKVCLRGVMSKRLVKKMLEIKE